MRDLLTTPDRFRSTLLERQIEYSPSTGLFRESIDGEATMLERAAPVPWFTGDELESVFDVLRGVRAEVEDDGWTTLTDSGQTDLAWVRSRVPTPVRVHLLWTRDAGAGPEVLWESEQSMRVDSTAVVLDVIETHELANFHFDSSNGGCGPIPHFAPRSEGASLALRLMGHPDGRSMVAEVVARLATDHPREATASRSRRDAAGVAMDSGLARTAAAAGVECPDRSYTHFGGALALTRATPARVEWRDQEGRRHTLQLTVRWSERAAPTRAVGGRPAALFVGTVVDRPVSQFRDVTKLEMADPFRFRGLRWGRPATDPELGGVMADTRGGAVSWLEHGDVPDSATKVLLLDAHAKDATEVLARRVDARLASCSLQFILLDVPLGTQADFGTYLSDPKLPAPGNGVRVIGSSRTQAYADHWVTFAGHRHRRYVVDWDAEVSMHRRIRVPRLEIAHDGWDADLCAERAADGRIETLAVRGSVRAVTGTRTFPTLGRWGFPVEAPVRAAVPFDLRIPLDAHGMGLARRSAQSVLGPGRELVIVASSRLN